MERINRYFEGVAWKYLTAVDAESSRSNQHELGGLVRAGFKQHLGHPGDDTIRFSARFIFLAEDEDESISVGGSVSWYDSRRDNPDRGPELRLYYESNDVTDNIGEGMLLVIAKSGAGQLFLIFADRGSSAENQLRWLFGLNGTHDAFSAKSFDSTDQRELWPSIWILEQLGIEVSIPDEGWLDRIISEFGESFPATRSFSEFARASVTDTDAIGAPDAALIKFMEMEERLFRQLEGHIVAKDLEAGFEGVDEFVSYSLSVQNRRKSRAGHAFENHLAYIFSANRLRFERGVVTENRARPDFLFPGAKEYRNPDFPDAGLCMLGVKSSCKDRWRQVLAEAQRISRKHLATLEPGISQFQTDEMQSHKLRLVVPGPIQDTYTEGQKAWLLSLSDFIGVVRLQQSKN